MSANSKKGGYTKVVYAATVGMVTASTSILGLLNGTLIGEGEALTVEDSEGRPIATGTRQSAIIRTSAVTSAPIAALETIKNACTAQYFRFYAKGGGRIKLGPVRVSAVRFAGAAPGELHQYIIELSAFEADSTDMIVIEA